MEIERRSIRGKLLDTREIDPAALGEKFRRAVVAVESARGRVNYWPDWERSSVMGLDERSWKIFWEAVGLSGEET